MKLAITISGETHDAPFDPRFGRATAFLFADLSTGTREIIPNPGLAAPGGAGVQAAQLIANLGAGAVVSGAFGPKAFQALQAAKIDMLLAPERDRLTANEVIALYENRQLHPATSPSHSGNHGEPS